MYNPLYGLCGSCKHFKKENNFCDLHKRTVIKIGSCYLYDPDKDTSPLVDVSDKVFKLEN